jgi:hypothetical protein
MRFLLIHDGREVGMTPDMGSTGSEMRFFEFEGTHYAVIKSWIRASVSEAVRVLEVVPKVEYLDPASLERFRACQQVPVMADASPRRRRRLAHQVA